MARLRRATVSGLATQAWTMRHNITFTDACYIALARRLDAPLLTSDMQLVAAPTFLQSNSSTSDASPTRRPLIERVSQHRPSP